MLQPLNLEPISLGLDVFGLTITLIEPKLD